MAVYHGGIAHRGRHSSYGNENIISLSPNLQELVERNGLDAFISIDTSGQPILNVRGNRGLAQSPDFHYKLTNQQMATIMKGDTYYKDNSAYDTFNKIIANDFVPPENFTVARNSGINRYGDNMRTMVNMGWAGIPTVRRPYGTYGPRLTTWEGMRADGSRRPGESAAMRKMPDGSLAPTAGYIWKGNLQINKAQVNTQKLPISITPEQIKPTAAPRPERGQAEALILDTGGMSRSAGNDTGQNFVEQMKTHGIEIRSKKNAEGNAEYQLIVKPLNARRNFMYDLTESEYKTLTADHYTNNLPKRLDIISNKIKDDFNEKVTIDMLKTSDYIDLTYKPGMQEVHEADFILYDRMIAQQKAEEQQLARLRTEILIDTKRISADNRAVDGRLITEIMESAGHGQKAFFENTRNGRQLSVSEIRVDERRNDDKFIEATERYKFASKYGITKEMDRDSLEAVKTQINIDYDTLDVKRLNHQELSQNEKERMANLRELAVQISAKLDGNKNNLDAWITMPDRKNFPEPKTEYVMAAQINGEWQEKLITKKEYDKFQDYDDAHKLNMFTDKFDKIKIANGTDYSLIPERTLRGYQLTQDAIRDQSQRTDINMAILGNMKKAFYAEGEGGRQKDVQAVFIVNDANIKRLEATLPEGMENKKMLNDLKEANKNAQSKQLHVIAAVIDGHVVQHAMTDKQYEKFMRSNDEGRLKIADKIFDEFKVKLTAEGRKERNQKTKDTILGVFGGVAGVALAGAAIKRDIDRMSHRHPGHRMVADNMRGRFVNTNMPPAYPPPGPRYSDIAIARYEYLIRDTQEAVNSLGRGR